MALYVNAVQREADNVGKIPSKTQKELRCWSYGCGF